MGVGSDNSLASPIVFGCLKIDVLKLHGVNVVADVQNLPFQNKVFCDAFCFHVLEHLPNPAKALAELVRVACRSVEVEVPHFYGRMAKSQSWKKGDVAQYHLSSFHCSWFQKCLKNFRYCIKVFYEFPRDLHIHVWIYLTEKAYT